MWQWYNNKEGKLLKDEIASHPDTAHKFACIGMARKDRFFSFVLNFVFDF
jgi:hypothetical protein